MRIEPRPLRALVLVGAAGLLASCATSPKGTAASGPPSLSSVVGGRFVSRVELDHGGLVVTPAGKRKARLSMRSAEAMFRAADVVDGDFRFAVLGLGVVTVSSQVSTPTPSGTPSTTTFAGGPNGSAGTTTTAAARSTTTGAAGPTSTSGPTTTAGAPGATGAPTTATTPPTPALLPRYDNRLAWVGIAWGAGCSGATGDSAPGTRYVAVVLDAETGASALAYTSRGVPPCGGAAEPPSVVRPTELVSVPWQPVGPGSTAVRVTVQACGTFFGWTDVAGAGQPSVQVVAQTPFDPDCGSSATVIQIVSDVVPLGKAQAQVPHAGLGPVDVLRTLVGG